MELDEISGAMVSGGAEQAAAVHLDNPDGSVSLFGFVTPADIDISKLKAHLSRMLPAFMIPSMIWPLEELPYNSSGKTNIPILKEWARDPSKISKRQNTPGTAPEITAHEPPSFVMAAETPAVKDVPAKEKTSGNGPAGGRSGVSAEELLEIWQGVLGRSNLSAEVSFSSREGLPLER